MGHRPAHPAGLARRVADQPGLALSRALPARPPALDQQLLGLVGEQPPREVLRPHRERQAHPRRRNGTLAAVRAGRRSRAGGGAMNWRPHWRPNIHEREVDEELRFHLDMEAEKLRGAGMSDAEARRAARRVFGGVRRVREEIRDLRRTRAVELFLRDVAYGWRSLRQAPAYALTTILTVSIAVGVCAAMLTFIEAALVRPLPYRNVDRVVTLWETN